MALLHVLVVLIQDDFILGGAGAAGEKSYGLAKELLLNHRLQHKDVVGWWISI